MLSGIIRSLKLFMRGIYQYFYKGYLRHYYESAMHPTPIRFILFAIAGAMFVVLLAGYSTFAIINDEFEGGAVKAYGLTAFMYLIGLAIILTIILRIQGYRHRDKIRALEKIPDLPKNSGNEAWKILLIVGLIIAIRKYFDW